MPGAALYSYYTTGELKAEGSSITEGIGQGRITANLEGLESTTAFLIPDEEASRSPMTCSSTRACASACRRASTSPARSGSPDKLGPGKTIVTMLCDPGVRYQSRLYNPEFLRSKGLAAAGLARAAAIDRAGLRPVDVNGYRRCCFATRIKEAPGMTLSIGSVAPDFTAETTQGTIHFHDWIGDSYAILFSHPKDYTPVCTTELGYLAGLEDEFSEAQHQGHRPVGRPGRRHEGWLQDIKDVTGNDVNYPIIGDHDLKVAKLYNMLPADAGETADGRTAANNATVRTVYIVGPDKLIKAMLIYPMSTGRNFDEVLRLLDSIQLTAKHSVATPVNWKQGEDCIIVPSLNDEAAREKFPSGWETVKPYLRKVPQPAD